MRRWLSRGLVAGAAFAACWLGALWYWQATRRMPGSDDLLIYLVLLPLLLLLLIWGGGKLLGSVARPAAAGAAAAAASSAAAAAAVPGVTGMPAVPALAAPLAVLAGALRMPHGELAAALATALLARQAYPALDAELQDEHGFPILSGRVDAVDTQAQRERMAGWLRQHHPDSAWSEFSDEQWRALALGSAVAAELGAELGRHPVLPAWRDATAAGTATPPLPLLHLVTLLPPAWPAPARAAAEGWLRAEVAQHGWPEARMAPPSPPSPPSQPLPSPSPLPLLSLGLAPQSHSQPQSQLQPQPLALLGQLAGHASLAQQPFLCLLLACGSHLGAASVAHWSEQATLLDSHHPDGRIPGEGGAGLLLADRAEAARFGRADAVLLYPASSALRASATDAKGRGDSAVLAQLAGAALASAGQDGAGVALLAADSDQRPGRIDELLGMARATLPGLDLPSQVLAVASGCGDAGAVSAVAALVLAQQQAGTGAGPVLCVSNLDPHYRSAVLLAAPAPPAAPATAPSDTLNQALAPL